MTKKQKQIAALSAAVPLMLSAAGCGNIPDHAETLPETGTVYVGEKADLMEQITAHAADGTEPDAAFRRSEMQFTLSLLNSVMKEQPGQNTMVSPYSVMQALGMTANGAAGDTLTEMLNVLGSGISAEQLNSYLCAWRSMQQNRASGDASYLETANAIWMRDTEHLNVQEKFLQTNADFFGAAAYKAPFDESTVTDINNWVKKQTHEMIPELIERIDPTTMLYLVNAAAFEAKWMEPYEKTAVQEGIFHAGSGENQSAKMMRSTEYSYMSSDGAVGFAKRYQGNYYFAAILPPEGVTPAEWLAQQDADSIISMLDNTESAEVHATLPAFSYDTGCELSSVLKEMGMPLAFSQSADFSAMAEIDAGLSIGSVLHKTHIDVNTDGTRAAAATAVDMRVKGALPPMDYYTVVLDRPFVYMILDTKVFLPVFIGTVEHM